MTVTVQFKQEYSVTVTVTVQLVTPFAYKFEWDHARCEHRTYVLLRLHIHAVRAITHVCMHAAPPNLHQL